MNSGWLPRRRATALTWENRPTSRPTGKVSPTRRTSSSAFSWPRC